MTMTTGAPNASNDKKRKLWMALAMLLTIVPIGLVAIVLSGSSDPLLMEIEVLEAEAERLFALGDVETGDRLVNVTYECHACHVSGNATIAPMFEQLAENAFNQRPELSPVAYIYESIVDPGAHIVEGYTNSMPNNYRARLTDEEIGAMLVYLLETYASP